MMLFLTKWKLTFLRRLFSGEYIGYASRPPLQRDEQAKDSLSLMSKKLEMIALDISNKR